MRRGLFVRTAKTTAVRRPRRSRIGIAALTLAAVVAADLVASTPPVAAAAKPSPIPAPLRADVKSPVAQGISGKGPQPLSSKPATKASIPTVTPHKLTGFDAKTSKPIARTDKTTTFLNTDGTKTLQSSLTAINYQDTSGAWHEVDNSVVADSDQAGGFVSKANAWRAHFGPNGLVVETKAGHFSMTAVGAKLGNLTVNKAGDGVTYGDAWPGVDLTYTVTGDSVKESVMLKSAVAPSQFAFRIRSGDKKQLLGGGGTDLGIAGKKDGTMGLAGAIGALVTLEKPTVLRPDGEPVEGVNANLLNYGGRAMLSIDPLWLASQPASSFPINLDPTVGFSPSQTWAFKSDGYSCTGCGVQTGNSHEPADKYWRSYAQYPVSSLAGRQVLDVSVGVSLTSGTANNYFTGLWTANSISFGGLGSGLASGTPGSGGYLSSATLTQYVASVVAASNSSITFGFSGAETSGVYTYQKWTTALYITYNTAPTVSLVSPANGIVAHGPTWALQPSASDADGDALLYDYVVATGTDAASGNIVCDTHWVSNTSYNCSIPYPYWNTTLYWRVYVWDGIAPLASSPVWTLRSSDNAPSAATPLTPGAPNAGHPAVIASTTPTLTASSSDADGDTVYYNFSVSGNGEAPAGRVSSGWTSNSWTVPTGVLADGQTYSWNVSTADGPATTTGYWNITQSATAYLQVNKRLGEQSVAPSDSLGGVSVNLANGNALVQVAPHSVNTVGGSLGVGLTYNSQAAVTTGLVGQYYADTDRAWNFATAGSPALVRVDPQLGLTWGGTGQPATPPGLPAAQYLVRWTGYLTVPQDGTYVLGLASDDGSRMYLDGSASPVIDSWGGTTGGTTYTRTFSANAPVKIEIDYYNAGGTGSIYFRANGPNGASSPTVDVPTSWLSPSLSTLPQGWSLSLPGGAGGYTRAATGSGSVVLTDSGGGTHTYLATSGGAYVPPGNEDGVLTAITAGTNTGGWLLRDSDGSTYEFAANGNPTSATTATDSTHPVAATYGYDNAVSPPRVSKVNDPVSQRSIYLYYGTDVNCPTPPTDYDAAAPTNALCRVSYWDGTTTDLLYASGQLSAVIEPGNVVTQFGYAQGLLTSIKAPLAVDWQNAAAGRSSAPVTTDIAYNWVIGDAANNVRPAYNLATQTNGVYPVGSVPMVTSVMAPSPDGGTAARPQHSYTYVGTNETQVHVASLATAVDGDVTYDSTGRTLTNTSATGQTTASAWDAQGSDLPTYSDDAAGRRTTTLYDWAERATDTYGPAPRTCFQPSGFPLVSPPSSCGVIPHSHTGYDTDTSGNRLVGLDAAVFQNPNLSPRIPDPAYPTPTPDPTDPSGVKSVNSVKRLTAVPNSGSWSSGQSATLGAAKGSVSYTGDVALPPGSYTFGATVGDKANDGVQVTVDDQPVVSRWMPERQAILADNPVEYWRLKETSGTTVSNEKTTNTGWASNVGYNASSVNSDDPTPTMSFNGTSSYVNLPQGLISGSTSTVINPTVEMWFRPTGPGVLFGYQGVVADSAMGGNYVPALYIGTDGALRGMFFTQGVGLNPITTAGSIVDSNWHHVVLAQNGPQQSMYLDGGLVGTRTGTNNLAGMPYEQVGDGNAVGWPGASTNNAWSHFNGQIADVAVYNYGLTQSQAVSHYQGGVSKLAGTTPATFTAFPTASAVAGTLKTTILGQSPTGYWRLNDQPLSSTAANAVSGGAAGAATSVSFGATSFGPADQATAATFDGASSKVVLPQGLISGTSTTTTSPSIAMWFKTLKPGVLFGYQAASDATEPMGGAYVPALYIGADGALRGMFYTNGIGLNPITSNRPVNDGAWHQAVLTQSGPTQTMYLDGVAMGTRTGTNNLAGMPYNQVGDGNASGWPSAPNSSAWSHFNGQIADVAVYNTALSTAQVTAQQLAGLSLASSPVVPGSLPAAPVSIPHRIKVTFRNPVAAAAGFTLTYKSTAAGSVVATIPDSAFSPRDGLATYSVTDDAGGISGGKTVSATSYSGSGLDPAYGLATDSIVDPGGLNLDTKTAYEAPGAGGYLRPTTSALPSASVTNAAQSRVTAYYGDTQTMSNPCVAGSPAVNQGGLPQTVTNPAPASGGAIATTQIYDAAGRVVASQITSDVGKWTCTTYDDHGRPLSVVVPTLNGAASRTVTNTYKVGGDPLTNSTTDPSVGTITTVSDLLGRVVSYTDVKGTVTTTSYDQAGRVTQQVTTANGTTSTTSQTYLDDGRVTAVLVDGKTVAQPQYDANAEPTGVIYPAAGTSTAGNGVSSTITKDAQGRQTALAYALPGSHAMGDSVSLSQSGRVMTANATKDGGAALSSWAYTYDAAARLAQAVLAANGATPAVTYGYNYAGSGGCGADAAAGLDGARSSSSVQVGTGTVSVTTSCTDYAGRLTSASGVNPTTAVYNSHGDATTIGTQTFTYDSSDRVTSGSSTSGGVTQNVTYTLDMAGRLVTRVASGTGVGVDTSTTNYSFTGDGDTGDIQLTGTGTIGERYIALPGGALLTKRYAFTGGDIWSLSNIHGDVLCTTDAAGTVTGSRAIYDPFGNPVNVATGTVDLTKDPTTRTGGLTDGWEGSHQRGAEHTGTANWINMGARIYLPTYGQFASVDPVYGGNSTAYAYPQDPINNSDLTGLARKGRTFKFRSRLRSGLFGGCGFLGLSDCPPKPKSGLSASFCGNVGCINYQLTPGGRVNWTIVTYDGNSGAFSDIKVMVNGRVVDPKAVYLGIPHGSVHQNDLPFDRDNIVSISATYTFSCFGFFTCTAHEVWNQFLVPAYSH